jgi:small subunit ribosomal protein S4
VQNTATQVICGLHLLKEKQLKNLFTKLKDKKGNIREDLLTNLESRLGNLIFRSGLVNTSRFARQWVIHGHFLVNGKKVDKPNYLVKPGDTITLEEKMRNNELIKQQLKQNIKTPTYLEVDKEKFNIVYSRYPSLEEAERGMDIFSVISRYKK